MNRPLGSKRPVEMVPPMVPPPNVCNTPKGVCSGNGNCLNGRCNCNAGFTGPSC